MSALAIAADHAGVALKAELVTELKKLGHEVIDLGPASTDSVDYPDFATKLTALVTAGTPALGILVCGTGIGMSIAANKVKGIRAAVCRTEFEARATRQHNDANVLCLGQRVTGAGVALEIAKVFLSTGFEGGRHQARVDKVKALEGGR
ncbi:MAG: ribose 5-phosphate isomerase B [Myxococcaceae bacterium]|nr:ribose 5-phosphate isomerase B [Myxococcaceae bacterium]